MTNHTATIIDFSAYRGRRASATAALDVGGSEAMPNFAFMFIPASLPIFWYHVWVTSLFPGRKAAH